MQCFEFLLLLTSFGNQVTHETETSNKLLQQKTEMSYKLILTQVSNYCIVFFN
mgnify:CR=1 FL=1